MRGETVLKVRKKFALDFADRMIMCNFAHTTACRHNVP